MRSRLRVTSACAATVILCVAAAVLFISPASHTPSIEAEPQQSSASTVLPPKAVVPETLPIASGDTLEELLQRAGLDRTDSMQVISAVKKTFDVRNFRAGSHLMLTRSETGSVQSIEYNIDPDRKLSVSHDQGAFASAVVEIPSTIRVLPVCGTVEGSLFESIERAGERPDLAVRIAEIFRWDLDFYRDPQAGDEFCLVIEKKEYENDQPPGYGRILAAKYNNSGSVYEAYLFPDSRGEDAYYSQDGRSLRSAFLRSPIKFEARVSSRFSRRRFHPVLRVYRPHLGTDYAVPTGTPVQSIAAGKVVFSGRTSGAGNLVRIEHSGGYETQYLHLSRRLVRRGQRVQQGQRIGLVGATGLATGPHLDLRIRKNGVFLDFERLKAPRVTRVSSPEFDAVRQQYSKMMRPSTSMVAAVPTNKASETLP